VLAVTQVWLFISVLQAVSNRLHVSVLHAVIFRPCFYKEKCRSRSLVCGCGYWDHSLLYELIL